MSDFWQSFAPDGSIVPSVRVEPGHPAAGTFVHCSALGASVGHYMGPVSTMGYAGPRGRSDHYRPPAFDLPPVFDSYADGGDE